MSEPKATEKKFAWQVTYRQSARSARARRWTVLAATREAAERAATETLRTLDPKGRVLEVAPKGESGCLS